MYLYNDLMKDVLNIARLGIKDDFTWQGVRSQILNKFNNFKRQLEEEDESEESASHDEEDTNEEGD